MEAAERKITLFMDNTPCYLKSLIDRSVNVKVVFSSKNTTSSFQPFDAGINFIVQYFKKLLNLKNCKGDRHHPRS